RPRSLHLPLLFPLTAPPPRSTLFPYTTLFRSHALVRIGLAALERRPGGREPHRTQAQLLARQRRGHHREHQRAAPTEACSLTGQDRKSTRLNSSHVKISYAVFCLKKKNKTTQT